MKYVKSGQYEMTKVAITTNTRNPLVVDVLSSFVDGIVYESIFEHTMSGNITIADTNNIRQTHGLGQGESIELVWSTASVGGEPITVTGIVYDISEPARVNDHASAFTLHFTSHEVFNSIKRRAFSGYNTTCDNIVKGLYESMRRDEPLKQKELMTLQTRNIENFVFTGQPTLAAIQMMVECSESSNGTQGYTFFENNLQFEFTTVEELYKKDPVIEYTYSSKPAYKDVNAIQEESFTSFQEFEYNIPNKYADDVLDGQKGSSTANLSILEKSITIHDYDAQDNYNPDNSLGKVASTIDYTPNSQYPAKLSVKYYHERAPRETTLVNNKMKMLKSNTLSLNIGVFGASFIKAGDVCLANVPSFSSLDFSANSTDVVSGKFLIAEIKHILTPKSYNQRIQLIKDSLEEALA